MSLCTWWSLCRVSMNVTEEESLNLSVKHYYYIPLTAFLQDNLGKPSPER